MPGSGFLGFRGQGPANFGFGALGFRLSGFRLSLSHKQANLRIVPSWVLGTVRGSAFRSIVDGALGSAAEASGIVLTKVAVTWYLDVLHGM